MLRYATMLISKEALPLVPSDVYVLKIEMQWAVYRKLLTDKKCVAVSTLYSHE